MLLQSSEKFDRYWETLMQKIIFLTFRQRLRLLNSSIQKLSSLFYFSDVNECASNTHNCNDNAICTNTNGSFTCVCKNGFLGNGVNCTGWWNELLIQSISPNFALGFFCDIQQNVTKIKETRKVAKRLPVK
jgi:hypothetical protein